MCTLLDLKWITSKDLLSSTRNSAQCYMAAWMGGEFGGEWIHVYTWLSPFAVHLKLSRHCSLTLLQYKIKSFVCVCVCVLMTVIICDPECTSTFSKSKTPFIPAGWVMRAQSCLVLCDTMDYSPPNCSVHRISQAKNTGVGCHFLLQEILTQESNLCLLHWQADSLPLSHLGSPRWVMREPDGQALGSPSGFLLS